MTAFEFDRERHIYRLDGAIIPSLSELLRGITEPIYSHVPDQSVVEAAKIRGSQAHLDTELFDKGEVDHFVSPNAAAWREFRSATGFTPTHIEYSTYHPTVKFGTTIDRLGVIGKTQWLIDIKTGTPSRWHALQTGGQALALSAHGIVSRDVRRANVVLSANGPAGEYAIHLHEQPFDVNYFYHYAQVQKWRHLYE